MNDSLEKIEREKKIKISLTNNEILRKIGLIIDGKQINGYINEDGIFLNKDSKKSLNKILGHEITHTLEGSKLYEALATSVKEYAESIGKSYEELRKETQERYSDKDGNLIEKNIDIDKELTADLIGEYLFSDEEFVKRLSTQNRNLFQKIYDEIKYLSKLITSGSKEGRQLEKAKNLFEKVYRQQSTNIPSNTQYAIESTKDGMKYVVDNQLQIDNELSQRDIFNILKGTEYSFEDGDKAYIVGWLKSNNKNTKNKSIYNELFTRYPSIFKRRY